MSAGPWLSANQRTRRRWFETIASDSKGLRDLPNSKQNGTEPTVNSTQSGTALPRGGFPQKLAYAARVLPGLAWQRLTRSVPEGKVHLIIALADHFEPAIVPGNGRARAPHGEQAARMERWCREYPRVVDKWRDSDGRPFVHTYFYPAEQYDPGHISRLADHCRAGWGEIEVHLHHGIPAPDNAANLRRTLVTFRDTVALEHGCLSGVGDQREPYFCFVHGNFALANAAGGFGCGVDDELQILAETGCMADLTLPTNPFNPAQRSMVNSLYECRLPLSERAAYRSGIVLARGCVPSKFPLMLQGPLMISFVPGARRPRIDNGAFTAKNPPTVQRLQTWKRARIAVEGKPDWIFIKLHCHSMDPEQEDAVLGSGFRSFLESLVSGAAERGEILHFVSAREMVNIVLAACDGKEGNPGDYRDYRFKRWRELNQYSSVAGIRSQTVGKN